MLEERFVEAAGSKAMCDNSPACACRPTEFAVPRSDRFRRPRPGRAKISGSSGLTAWTAIIAKETIKVTSRYGVLPGPGFRLMGRQCRHCRTHRRIACPPFGRHRRRCHQERSPGFPLCSNRSPALIARGRMLDCDCLLGPAAHPFHASIRAGRIVDLAPAPVLMRSWRFSYRATSAAWTEYWQPVPQPGWHDLSR